MRPAPRTARRWAPLGTLATIVALLLPASAWGHVHVLVSSPAQDAVLTAPPDRIELQFSGEVVAGPGSIRVFDAEERELQAGAPRVAGVRLTQPITSSTASGTWGVAYRVSSQDGHVITGSLSFVVGTPSAKGEGAAAVVEQTATVDPRLERAFTASRFVELLALLAIAGGGIFACLIVPGWRPRWLIAATVAFLTAAAAAYVLNAAIAAGIGLGEALDADVLRDASDTPFARALGIRVLIACISLAPTMLLRMQQPAGRGARWSGAVVYAALAASVSLSGHAATTDPLALRMPLDMLHMVAAGVWLGGLLQLAYLAPSAAERLNEVERFSRTAAGSVAVLLATGTYATLNELDLQLHELVDSTYGRLVAAKLLLFIGTMPLAWANLTAFVPRARQRPEDAPRMLRQYAWRELALLVVVTALTAWLIATPQPS